MMTKALVCKEPELKAGIAMSLKRILALEKIFSAAMDDYVCARTAVRDFYVKEYLPRLSPFLDELEKLRNALTGFNAKAVAAAEGPGAQPRPETAPCADGEMKALYRKLARAYHPDTASGEWERLFLTERMAEVNGAFRERDMKALKRLLKRCAAETGLGGLSSLSRLEHLRADETALKAITAECRVMLAELRAKEVYRTMVEAREKGRTFFEKKELDLRSLIDVYRRVLARTPAGAGRGPGR